MIKPQKTRIYLFFSLFVFVLTHGCSEKDYNKSDPAESFAYAKEPYDDESYDTALTRLGEFKSRFPYSKYAVEAELLIANSHFKLEHYEEAAAAYAQFVKLHPKHEQVDFAMYRVGESYWVDAPEAINREQEYTFKAIEEWNKLIVRFPKSKYSEKAAEFIEKGKRRIAESFDFIAKFYCKLEIYHACAYRYQLLVRDYPQYKDLYKNALEQAGKAFLKLSEIKAADPESDKNIFFKKMSSSELKENGEKLIKESAEVR
ncbi:MAG: outer membrane protein assembly factor BamD [Oligoflexales bacterium]|nr:outer membrane protein assembly factor BamD [Oligoflexales bacterium]